MILLDTTVLSALMRDAPDAMVTGWLDRQPAESIWITSLTLCEVRFGLALLPPGRKRRALETAFDRLVDEDLEQRIVDVDPSAAAAAATLAAARQAAGRPVDVRDTLLAGIALARRATFATRHVRHFADLDVPVVNPWEPAG
jgi:toxin FitB